MKQILDIVKPDFDKRVQRLQETLGEPSEVITEVLNMDRQDCYSVFGCTNDNLEGLEWIIGMLINGILDDAYLGVTEEFNVLKIAYVSDMVHRWLREDDVLLIVRKAGIASKYYKDNKESIEGRSLRNEHRSEYYRLNKEFKKLMEEYKI